MSPVNMRCGACLLVSLAGGCQHAAPRPPIEGASSFRIIEPVPPETKMAVADSSTPMEWADVIVAAEPELPLVSPIYPQSALGKTTQASLVGVELFIDSSGRVARTGPSLRAFSTPGPLAAEFAAAVEEAVRQWRFRPAEKRRMRRIKGPAGGEDFWLVTQAEKTDGRLDVAFTFTAKGDVLPSR